MRENGGEFRGTEVGHSVSEGEFACAPHTCLMSAGLSAIIIMPFHAHVSPFVSL